MNRSSSPSLEEEGIEMEIRKEKGVRMSAINCDDEKRKEEGRRKR